MTCGSCDVTGLSIDSDRTDQHLNVCLSGELDMHTAKRLRGEFAELISSHPGVEVALDVSELTFTDSSGLSALIAVHKQTSAAGGRLVIHHPNQRLTRMLAITGLDSVLLVQPYPEGDTRKGTA